MIKLKYLSENKYSEWHYFLSSLLKPTVFHTIYWKKHIERTFNYTPFYIYASDGSEIVAVAPFFLVKSIVFGNRIISLPFTDNGGFCFKDTISFDDLEEFFLLLFSELQGIVRKFSIKYIEIRGWSRYYDSFLPDFNKFIITPFVNFKLDLKLGHELLFQKYRRNIRRHLSQDKGNIIIRECSNISELKEIFRIYSFEIRKFGSPPLPWSYFVSEWQHLRCQGLFFAFLAEVNFKIVGGITLICDHYNIYAEHIMSLLQYNHYYVKEKLYDYTISWASRSGYSTYNFCRCRKNSGVYHHKLGWGGEEEEISYLYSNYKDNADCIIDYSQKKFNLPKKILRLLPLEIVRFIGPFMRKEIAQ
jgi:hypothetical protein